MTSRSNWCCGNLRIMCLVIGYMHLIAAIVDIVLHFFIVAVGSRGFECDVDRRALQSVNWPWLELILFMINLGTHGFYPFPLILRSFNNAQVEYMSIPVQPRCYPGMIHIYQIDVLNLLINGIWLKFVISYVRAVYRKDPDSMRMFFGLSVVKQILQVMYFAYESDFQSIPVEIYWMIKGVDIGIATIFLFAINKYIRQLRSEKAQQIVDQPPSYIECLINGTQIKKEEKTAVTTVQPTEQKVDLSTVAAAEPRA